MLITAWAITPPSPAWLFPRPEQTCIHRFLRRSVLWKVPSTAAPISPASTWWMPSLLKSVWMRLTRRFVPLSSGFWLKTFLTKAALFTESATRSTRSRIRVACFWWKKLLRWLRLPAATKSSNFIIVLKRLLLLILRRARGSTFAPMWTFTAAWSMTWCRFPKTFIRRCLLRAGLSAGWLIF